MSLDFPIFDLPNLIDRYNKENRCDLSPGNDFGITSFSIQRLKRLQLLRRCILEAHLIHDSKIKLTTGDAARLSWEKANQEALENPNVLEELRKKSAGYPERITFFNQLEKSLNQEGHTEHLHVDACLRLSDFIEHADHFIKKLQKKVNSLGFFYQVWCFLTITPPLPPSIKKACQAYIDKAQHSIRQIENFRLNALLARLEHASDGDDVENGDIQHHRVKKLYDLGILESHEGKTFFKRLPYYPDARRDISQKKFTEMVNHLLMGNYAQQKRLLRLRFFNRWYNFQNVIPIETTIRNGQFVFSIKDAPQKNQRINEGTFFNTTRAFEIARINQCARKISSLKNAQSVTLLLEAWDKCESFLLSEIKQAKKAIVPWIINVLFKRENEQINHYQQTLINVLNHTVVKGQLDQLEQAVIEANRPLINTLNLRLEHLAKKRVLEPNLKQRWHVLMTKASTSVPKHPLAQCKSLNDVIKTSLQLLSQGENIPLRIITHLEQLLKDKKSLFENEIRKTVSELFKALRKKDGQIANFTSLEASHFLKRTLALNTLCEPLEALQLKQYVYELLSQTLSKPINNQEALGLIHSLLVIILKEPHLARQLAELSSHQRLGNPLLLDHSRHILIANLKQKSNTIHEEIIVSQFALKEPYIKKCIKQQLESQLPSPLHRQLAIDLSQRLSEKPDEELTNVITPGQSEAILIKSCDNADELTHWITVNAKVIAIENAVKTNQISSAFLWIESIEAELSMFLKNNKDEQNNLQHFELRHARIF